MCLMSFSISCSCAMRSATAPAGFRQSWSCTEWVERPLVSSLLRDEILEDIDDLHRACRCGSVQRVSYAKFGRMHLLLGILSDLFELRRFMVHIISSC